MQSGLVGMRTVFGNAWRRVAELLLTCVLAAGLASCGGGRSASGNDVEVSASGPTDPLQPGSTVVFTMTVRNVGNNTASDIRLVDQLGSFLVMTSFTCEAAGGAVCPSLPATTMSVPTLPAGAYLTFKISATVNAVTSGTVSNTMTATAAEDIGRTNNSATATASVVGTSTSLGVAQDASATVAAGSAATFRVVLSNPSGATVANNVSLVWKVTAPSSIPLDGITYSCAATGGAECPAAQTPAASMTLVSGPLGTGRTLVYTFTVPTPATGRGNILSSASVTADGDSDPSNNESNVTTVAVDARNGIYHAYAADGRSYDLTVDFDAAQPTYTMSGNGASVTRTFTVNADGGYRVSGNVRFRVTEDLIVGEHDFAVGTMPYVAARTFVTSVSALPASLNLMTRNLNTDGSSPRTGQSTARVSGNVLQICRDETEVVQAQSCGVSSLKSYALSVSGDVFTASDTASTDTFSFRLARSGAASVLLAAGPSTMGDSTLQFTIGLPESAGLVDQVVIAAGVYGDARTEWPAITLGRATYVADGDYIADATGLFRIDVIDALAPVAMLQGAPTPTLDGAPIWVMQAYPLVVVTGATLTAEGQANASGLLQIGLP